MTPIEMDLTFIERALNLLQLLFVLVLGLIFAAVVLMYITDTLQTRDAIRRNYPVLGRFRALFTKLGEFFRQYFFAMDREEYPFNRAQREWVNRASGGRDNTIAFDDLDAYLLKAGIPYVAQLREAQNYVRAYTRGLGVHELPEYLAWPDWDEWEPFDAWLRSKRSMP